MKERKPVYYGEYLQLQNILNAQFPESAKEGIRADDEMLFIIIHQSYELWFKQITHELNIVRDVFKQPNISNNSADIYNCLHRLKRISAILELGVSQLGIMETMTPLDFLDFRDLLRPASGFQSIQFKVIEAALGLKFDDRHGKGYYLSQLKPEDVERVKKAEEEESLFSLIMKWLERMPFVNDPSYWYDATPFWQQYREAYKNSLSTAEASNLSIFDKMFIETSATIEGKKISQDAGRNALFIMLYRDYPLLHLPFELLSILLEIDEHLAMWRYRHIHMVQRVIGNRTGTGGSTGAQYLRGAADSHYIFREFAELTTFLLPRNMLPELPTKLVQDLSFIK